LHISLGLSVSSLRTIKTLDIDLNVIQNRTATLKGWALIVRRAAAVPDQEHFLWDVFAAKRAVGILRTLSIEFFIVVKVQSRRLYVKEFGGQINLSTFFASEPVDRQALGRLIPFS
jgi:hypothetical protein